MEKKLLFTDSQGISLATSNLHVFGKKIMKVVKEFLALKLGVPMTRELLVQLISNPQDCVFGVYKARIPVVDQHTGLKINVDQQMQNLVLPDLRQLKELCYDVARNGETLYTFLPLFDINSDEIVLNSKKTEQYLDTKYKFYSNDQVVIKLYNQLNQVATILNAVNASTGFITSSNSLVNFDTGQLFKFNPDKQLELKKDGFLQLARKL